MKKYNVCKIPIAIPTELLAYYLTCTISVSLTSKDIMDIIESYINGESYIDKSNVFFEEKLFSGLSELLDKVEWIRSYKILDEDGNGILVIKN